MNEQWAGIKTVQFSDDIDCDNAFQEAGGSDGNDELCNEIIEEHVLRNLSKSFCELFSEFSANYLSLLMQNISSLIFAQFFSFDDAYDSAILGQVVLALGGDLFQELIGKIG